MDSEFESYSPGDITEERKLDKTGGRKVSFAPDHVGSRYNNLPQLNTE